MSNTALSFNFAQNFFVEPNLKDSTKIKIVGFELYFKYKPAATNNRSGITNPGITVYLTDTIYDVPLINEKTFSQVARVEWAAIFTSSDSSMPTRVNFPNPIEVTAGKKYALVCAFDGDEAFWPWLAKVGMWIWGTRTIYTGQSGNLIGEYYEYTSSDTQNDPTTAQNQQQYRSYWRPLADSTLKFSVFAARYYIHGVPIIAVPGLDPSVIVHSNNLVQTSNGIGQLSLFYPAPCMEHVTFDLAQSTVQAFVGAQRVYQNTVFYPGGWANGSSSVNLTCNSSDIITANTLLPNGTAFNWNAIFGGYTGQKYVTLNSANVTNVRLVRSIISNTVLQVTEPVTFTNVATKFMISPIATVDSFDMNSPRGKKTEFMRMSGSNANSSVRFVNNCIETIAIANGGGLYKNSDILYIKGFANVAGKVLGGYVAVANIVTDGAGSITNVYLSNLGCGFVNNAQIVPVVATANQVGNITSNTSTGTNAVFTYTVGATLKTELTNNIFKNCSLVNLDMNDASPFFDVFTPPGTTFSLSIETGYYLVRDSSTPDGYAYYVYPGGQEFNNIQLMKRNRFVADYIPVFMSYSNEFNTRYLNGSVNDTVNSYSVTSNNFILAVHTTSNNDWVTVTVDTTPTVEMTKYIMNNDYTFEETDQGNCWAKHVATRNTFARLSEDVRVTLEAYKPANTDIQVYCRIQNSGDPDAFDDANWTRLQLMDGLNMVSSLNDENNYIELTYGFQPYPNTALSLGGFVATSDGSANVIGFGTAFISQGLTVNSMVRIYDPYFPTTNYIVGTVTAVASQTQFTLDQPIFASVNPALVQGGMKVDKLNYVHQAYTNITNDNVVRYYNTSLVKYDGYDTLQIKVLLLSSHLNHIPRIHSLRGLGVSA